MEKTHIILAALGALEIVFFFSYFLLSRRLRRVEKAVGMLLGREALGAFEKIFAEVADLNESKKPGRPKKK